MEFDEKPKRQGNDPFLSHEAHNSECIICGNATYEWGRVAGHSRTVYLPYGTWGGIGLGQTIHTRKCLRCGNLQMFAESAGFTQP